ncbi:XLF domain-containing protein [Trichoderma novae-zelandiae]
MSSDLTWRPLPQATSSDIPTLLVSVDIGAAAYTVRITDMANVWVERLDRKAIFMRGWSENTSIDPSDTPENMAKFLGSLRSALDPTQPGHEQTSLTLSPGSSADAGEDSLTLLVTCPLPGFQPLKWPIHLSKSPPSAIATDLVLPLLEAQFARKQEVDSLVQALHQKDAVIGKLADKLEATGTGLEHVFPSLSGKKKVSRAAAQDKVKGLAPFRQDSWRSSLKAIDDCPTNVGDLARNVFDGEGLNRRCQIQVDASPALDKWWHDFKGTSQLVHRHRQQTTPSAKKSPSPTAKSPSAEDDDFQVQPTPPHLQSRNKSSPVAIADDESTADEEDLAVEPAPSDPDPQPSTRKSASRMANSGSGESKPRTSLQDTTTAPSRATTAPVPGDDVETASEASDEDMASAHPGPSPKPTPTPAPAPMSPKPTPKAGGLGRIGGTAKRRAAETAAAPEVNETETAEDQTATKPPAPKKLGHIGKKADAGGSKAPTTDNTKRGRSTEREELQEEEGPRETSQERADRRREELKKDLERKAAAGPAKKKRRF